MVKEEYIAPIIDLIEYQVEEGFAQSAFIGDTDNEDVDHGEDYALDGDNPNDLWH